MLASTEPYVSLGGGSLPFVLGALFVGLAALVFIRNRVLPWLAIVADWCSITVLVFLRTGMGVREVSIGRILVGTGILYFVGNMIGHNYHDIYRSRGATIWGASVHFTYLVLFVCTAAYRRYCAGQMERQIRPSYQGHPSRLAMIMFRFMTANPKLEMEELEGFYQTVIAEPTWIIAVGLIAALIFQNWFGLYLVIVGSLLFYWYVYSSYRSREARLDAMDNPVKPGSS